MEILLTRGRVARIDDEDWDSVKGYCWYAAKLCGGKKWYVLANAWDRAERREYKAYLHRLIMKAAPGEQVDHFSGDMFDWRNRRHVRLPEAELEAARAYNEAVLPLAGEFARLNIVPDRMNSVPDCVPSSWAG